MPLTPAEASEPVTDIIPLAAKTRNAKIAQLRRQLHQVEDGGAEIPSRRIFGYARP